MWQRDLLRRLAGGALTAGDREEVIAMLLGEGKAPVPRPLAVGDLPADAGEHGVVALTRLGDLVNVNCIAAGEALGFEPGLNVVFGDNGAGKSGYTRLLRRVCRSARLGEVLRDVFDAGAADAPQTARVEIDAGGASAVFDIDLDDTPPKVLSAISVFDTDCAEFMLSKPNAVDWLPAALRLIRDLAAEQGVLADMLRQRAAEVRTAAPRPVIAEASSEAGRLLAALAGIAGLVEIERLAQFDDAELQELERLAGEAGMSDGGRADLIRAATARAAAGHRAVDAIRTAAGRVGDKTVERARAAVDELRAAEAAEQALASETFVGEPISGIGEAAWRRLWEAARAFVGEEAFPPADGDRCPLCQQDVDAIVGARMARLESWVRDRERDAAGRARRTVEELVAALPDAALLSAEVDAQLAVLPDGDDVEDARTALASTLVRIEALRRLLPNEVPPWTGSLTALEERIANDERKVEGLAAPAEQAVRLRDAARLSELRGRQQLAGVLAAARERAAALDRAQLCDQAVRDLSTNSITTLMRTLAGEVITERLATALVAELEGLDPVAGRVKVALQPAKGRPEVRLKFDQSREALGAVLSEGEQRGLALAFFLAEVTARQDGCAIVLDDPVSSLDDNRRRWVAARLVRESLQRQVIVFTHDVAFLHFLEQAVERTPGAALHGQRVARFRGRVGVVTTDLPSGAAAPGRRVRELRRRLRELRLLQRDSDPGYAREVERWLLDLRRGYEYVIEEGLLRGVVRRKSLRIRHGELPKVNPDPAVVKRVLHGIRDASEDAHYEPPELQAPPLTPDELETLLTAFTEVWEQANPAPKSQPAEVTQLRPVAEDDAASRGSGAA